MRLVRRTQIKSVAKPGFCIDDGDFPAPPGTSGNCAAIARGDSGDGPGLVLTNPNSGLCLPSVGFFKLMVVMCDVCTRACVHAC